MSRFFKRSCDSSSESEDGNDSPDISKSQQLDVFKNAGGGYTHRDMLLHALLEERCMNDVLHENKGNSSPRTRPDIEREGRLRYQRLCSQLTTLGLVATGLDHDKHLRSRETYRSGLNMLSGQDLPRTPIAVSTPPRNLLLSDLNVQHSLVSPRQPLQDIGALSLFDPSGQFALPRSQYLRDFEEIGMLGRGGFGTVYQAKHRLDNRVYAVKKVKICSSAITQIHSENDQSELEGILVELRTLAKLDHPNIVRYYSSWLEWTNPDSRNHSRSDDAPRSSDRGCSVEDSYATSAGSVASLRRVFTTGTENASLGEFGVTFEESFQNHAVARTISNANSSNDLQQNNMQAKDPVKNKRSPIANDQSGDAQTDVPSKVIEYSFANKSITQPAPILSLHIQMAMYPMTLADFLWPQFVAKHAYTPGFKPLAHCFHLETSIRIMMALLEGVDYIHSRGIVHRDLKPANIFLRLEKDTRPKHGHVDLMLCSACRANGSANPAILNICIGDFGLVSTIAEQVSAATISSSRTSFVVGTELYRPLQPSSNDELHVDIFALGIIAFELLYKFTTQMERRETLQNLRQGRFPPYMPPQAKEIISAMLSNDPKKHTTISELRVRLSTLLPA